LRGGGFAKPVIALTARALKEEVEHSLAAGCDAHVSKPVDRFDLVEIIRNHAGRTPQVSHQLH
jgi:CheY-like chemotaxis protein